MNFALTRTTLLPGGGARNLNRMTAAIQAAAQTTPSPDVIILSNVADPEPGPLGAPPVTPATCRGVTEAFSLQAREWGVWLIVGHALVQASDIVRGVTLFDPDGDPYLRIPNSAAGEDKTRAGDWTYRPTPVGHIALAWAEAGATDAWKSVAPEAAFDILILCGARDGVPLPTNVLEGIARGRSCVVAVLGNEGAALVDATGQTLIQTRPDSSSIETVQLDITPPSSSTIGRWGGLGDDE